ncbi:hypothetical protein KM043_016141 [Ampulex compressa]|nr:hypothetical protein KM043_016141 [Ampulex compressa]
MASSDFDTEGIISRKGTPTRAPVRDEPPTRHGASKTVLSQRAIYPPSALCNANILAQQCQRHCRGTASLSKSVGRHDDGAASPETAGRYYDI